MLSGLPSIRVLGVPTHDPGRSTDVSGHETIATMRCYLRSETYGYSIVPISDVVMMMYAAIGHESFTTFDPSNPIHAMMVSSAREAAGRDSKLENHLEDWLAGFERGAVPRNENLRVQLLNVGPYRKRFGVTSN